MTTESPDRIQNPKDGAELEKTLPHRPCRIEDIYSPKGGQVSPLKQTDRLQATREGVTLRSPSSSGPKP